MNCNIYYNRYKEIGIKIELKIKEAKKSYETNLRKKRQKLLEKIKYYNKSHCKIIKNISEIDKGPKYYYDIKGKLDIKVKQ